MYSAASTIAATLFSEEKLNAYKLIKSMHLTEVRMNQRKTATQVFEISATLKE